MAKAERALVRRNALAAVALVGVVGVLVAAACADRGRGDAVGATGRRTSPGLSAEAPQTVTSFATTIPVTSAPLPVLPPAPSVPRTGQWGPDRVPFPGSLVFDFSTLDTLVGTTDKVVALTFDDGPSAFTRQVAAILLREKVPATFFLIGKNARERPEDARYLASAGFRIGAHSMTHPKMSSLSRAEQAAEMYGSVDAVNEVVGPGTVKCFRPPFGAYNDDTLNLAAERGLGVVNWSVDSNDWHTPGMPAVFARVDRTVGARGIVLLHDGGGDRSETVAALPFIISSLRARGFEFVNLC